MGKIRFEVLLDSTRTMIIEARSHNIESVDGDMILGRAEQAGVEENFEVAIELIRQCQSAYSVAMIYRIIENMNNLERMAAIVRTIGGTSTDVGTSVKRMERLMALGDYRGVFEEQKSATKAIMNVLNGYIEANNRFAEMEKLASKAERLNVDVRAPIMFLQEARMARLRNDWQTMSDKTVLCRDALMDVLPEQVSVELNNMAETIKGIDGCGIDIASMQRLHQEAEVAWQNGSHEDALDRLLSLRDKLKGP